MSKKRISRTLIVAGVPTAYAILLRLFFGVRTWDNLYQVMSLTFLLCLPTIVGALTVYLSKVELAESIAYRIFAPWIPIFIFFVFTLAFSMEGFACWIMALPLFLVAASIGGLIGGFLKVRKENRIYMSVLTLLPLFMAPIENKIGALPGTYQATTSIDIHARPADIWGHVTRVIEIPQTEDKGWLTRFLGFPRPVKAELNFEGVGACREAIFTKGLTFHETVLQYEDLRKMVFTIKAYPYEIPSTTMDQHVVIGGDYFDVLNGTYILEPLTDSTCRLLLYSHFKLSTTFNFYASWWARWIMEDIQNNILQVIKKRSEHAD